MAQKRSALRTATYAREMSSSSCFLPGFSLAPGTFSFSASSLFILKSVEKREIETSVNVDVDADVDVHVHVYSPGCLGLFSARP